MPLKRDIGFLTLVALGVGGIIGSGVFVMPAVMGSVTGPALIIGLMLTELVTTLLAISYAELGSQRRRKLQSKQCTTRGAVLKSNTASRKLAAYGYFLLWNRLHRSMSQMQSKPSFD